VPPRAGEIIERYRRVELAARVVIAPDAGFIGCKVRDAENQCRVAARFIAFKVDNQGVERDGAAPLDFHCRHRRDESGAGFAAIGHQPVQIDEVHHIAVDGHIERARLVETGTQRQCAIMRLGIDVETAVVCFILSMDNHSHTNNNGK